MSLTPFKLRQAAAFFEQPPSHDMKPPPGGSFTGLLRSAADEIERLQTALTPFAAFAEKAEAFVDARVKDGGSPVMPPTTDFRLADFQRARAALSAAGQPEGGG